MVDPLAEIRVNNTISFTGNWIKKNASRNVFFLAIDNYASVKSVKVSYLLGRKNGSKVSVDSLLSWRCLVDVSCGQELHLVLISLVCLHQLLLTIQGSGGHNRLLNNKWTKYTQLVFGLFFIISIFCFWEISKLKFHFWWLAFPFSRNRKELWFITFSILQIHVAC